MKNLKKVIASAVVLFAIAQGANAQSTAYGTTTAVLVTPLSIEKTEDMHFGTVAATSTDGTVTLNFSDQRVADGGAYLPAGSNTQKTAVFTVTGEGNTGFDIAIPTAKINLSDGAGHTLEVGDFLCDLEGSSTLTNGSKVLKVAAKLYLTANAVAGTYKHDALDNSGLFVTVNYN